MISGISLRWLLGCATLLFISSVPAIAQKQNLKKDTVKVYGACMLCKHRIENALKGHDVYHAQWDIKTNMLAVSYDSTKISILKIQEKMASIGHDTEAFQTDDSTYESLPMCCYYSRYRKSVAVLEQDSIRHTPQIHHDAIVKGIVLEENKKGKLLPLVGASIRCFHTNHIETADSLGVFKILCKPPSQLIISYVGFDSDTIQVSSANEIKVILKKASSTNLNQVVVLAKRPSTYISSLDVLHTLRMGSKELTKAACCNLAESFETSPSIDVNYADAVTGVKQIQLLGLSGNYTPISTENIPEIRGLVGNYGLTYIPGPWIESIQVSKGAGSVANGYESIAGQINVEEKKPDTAEKLFVNTYGSSMGRLESTINLTKVLNSRWSTALLTHANGVFSKVDGNSDGFLDIPLGKQMNIINRWKYTSPNGVTAQLAAKLLADNRQGGQVDFDLSRDKFTTNHYGLGTQVQRYEIAGKLGYVFPQEKYKSIGLMFSVMDYTNESYYGLNRYDGKQRSLYTNLIYQSIIGSTIHKFRTGLSFVNDYYDEIFIRQNFKRTEVVPGGFFEYTYAPITKFTAVAGIRLDYHNQYRSIVTPRLHLKYDVTPETNLRFSVGSGFRTANIVAENAGLLVSSREWVMQSTHNYGYGLQREKAWNYGLSLAHQFRINSQPATFTMDAFRTTFTNQVVVDIDTDPKKVLFYDLNGQSFSNSIQAELNYEPVDKLDLRLAYRWLDVQTNYSGTLLQKPLVAKHRAFINTAYETTNRWKFDYTLQWFSKKRLPNSSIKQGEYSPAYLQMMAQITKQFGKALDVYVGGENLTDYQQKDPILGAREPFGLNFDGSIPWGPIYGRMFYLGLRYKIR